MARGAGSAKLRGCEPIAGADAVSHVVFPILWAVGLLVFAGLIVLRARVLFAARPAARFDRIPERLKTLDDAGLKLYQITMTVDITPGKPAYDSRFKDVLALVKGRLLDSTCHPLAGYKSYQIGLHHGWNG